MSHTAVSGENWPTTLQARPRAYERWGTHIDWFAPPQAERWATRVDWFAAPNILTRTAAGELGQLPRCYDPWMGVGGFEEIVGPVTVRIVGASPSKPGMALWNQYLYAQTREAGPRVESADLPRLVNIAAGFHRKTLESQEREQSLRVQQKLEVTSRNLELMGALIENDCLGIDLLLAFSQREGDLSLTMLSRMVDSEVDVVAPLLSKLVLLGALQVEGTLFRCTPTGRQILARFQEALASAP